MACCVLKSFCGCNQLRTGTIVVGHILLVLKLVWLYFWSKDIDEIIKHFRLSDFDNRSLITTVILTIVDEVRLVLEVIFTTILLVGLYKNKKGILRAIFPASAICYLIEIISYIYPLIYFEIQFDTVIIGVFVTADMITKLVSFFFLLLVRSNYLQTDSTNTGTVYSTAPRQSNLEMHDV